MISEYSDQPEFVHEKHPKQVIIIISGNSNKEIMARLDEIRTDIITFGRPIMGTNCFADSSVEIIRPRWE